MIKFIYLENNASNVYTSICLQELQAINKQVEELGWVGDKEWKTKKL